MQNGMKLKSFIILSWCLINMTSCNEIASDIDTNEPNLNNDSLPISNGESVTFDAEDTYEADLLPDGPFESYYPNKSLKAKGNVVNGKREGVWTSYHLNGNKQSENEYKKGVLNGKTVTIFESGQIMYIGYYLEGEYDGQWFFYTKDGELSKEIIYSKGEIVKITEGKDFNK